MSAAKHEQALGGFFPNVFSFLMLTFLLLCTCALCKVPSLHVTQEYKCGLQGSATALETLERTHGSKWRSVPALRQKWANRKVFYTAVEAVMKEKGCNDNEAVRHLQLQLDALPRMRNRPGWMAFLKQLRANMPNPKAKPTATRESISDNPSPPRNS